MIDGIIDISISILILIFLKYYVEMWLKIPYYIGCIIIIVRKKIFKAFSNKRHVKEERDEVKVY